MPATQHAKKKAFLKLSLWSLTLIAVVTGLNIIFIINSVSRGRVYPQRTVASAEEGGVAQKTETKAFLAEINCRKKTESLELATQASNFRVYFRNCEEPGRLINESNNSQGDIFPLGKGQWTSDFIVLVPGKNRIKIPLSDFVQVINITREISQKQTPQKAL